MRENIFMKYLYEKIYKNLKFEKEVTRDSVEHNHEIEIEIEKQDIFSRYVIEFMVESMSQLYAQESKFHFRNNH